MDKGTVLDYPGMPAERLLYWQKRAFREWAFRPGPIWTYLKMLVSDRSTLQSAVAPHRYGYPCPVRALYGLQDAGSASFPGIVLHVLKRMCR